MHWCPPGSSVILWGILRARILEWVAMSSATVSPRPRDRTCSSSGSYIAGVFFTNWAIWEAPICSYKISTNVYLKVYKIKCKLISMSHVMFCSNFTSPRKMKMVEYITKALKFFSLLASHFTVLFWTTTHLYVQATLTSDCPFAWTFHYVWNLLVFFFFPNVLLFFLIFF